MIKHRFSLWTTELYLKYVSNCIEIKALKYLTHDCYGNILCYQVSILVKTLMLINKIKIKFSPYGVDSAGEGITEGGPLPYSL